MKPITHRRSTYFLLALIGLICLVNAPIGIFPRAADALEINVRARAQLKIGVSTAGTLVRLSGALSDSHQKGLPQRPIEIRLVPLSDQFGQPAQSNGSDLPEDARLFSERIFTERSGVFHLDRELAPGKWRVEANFAETEYLTEATFQRDFEVRRARADLQLHVPAVVVADERGGANRQDVANKEGVANKQNVANSQDDADDLTHAASPQASPGELQVPLRVQATVEGVGLPAEAEVRVDDKVVGNLELDTFGRGTLAVPLGEFTPGEHAVRAEIIGANYVDAAPATASIRISEQVLVDADIHEVVERLRRGFGVRGVVSDQRGPLPGANIMVQLVDTLPRSRSKGDGGEQKVEVTQQVKTDQDGRFNAFFPTAELADGQWAAEVRVIPQVGSERVHSLDPVSLDRTTSRWVLNFLGVVGFLGGLGLLIQRFWRVILLYWTERRRKKEARERVETAMREVETLAPVAMPSQAQTQENPTTHASHLSGVVWDEWQDRAVLDAQIQILDSDGTIVFSHLLGSSLPTDPNSPTAPNSPTDPSSPTEPNSPTDPGDEEHIAGYFRTPKLPEGTYDLRIEAPGFMPAQMRFKLPHRGRLTQMRVDLVAIPLKIRRLYQTLVETLDGVDRWGALSPREIEGILVAALNAAKETDDPGNILATQPDGGEQDTPASGQIPEQDSAAKRQFIDALKMHLRSGEFEFGQPPAKPDPDSSDEAYDLDQLPQNPALAGAAGTQLLALMTAVVEETYFSGRTFDMAIWRFAREIAERLRERQNEAAP